MLINNATYQRETLLERPIRQPLIMMDKYNLWYILVWFARNKIKHEKFFAR